MKINMSKENTTCFSGRLFMSTISFSHVQDWQPIFSSSNTRKCRGWGWEVVELKKRFENRVR